MEKIAKKSQYKNIISKGGGPLAPAGGPWAPFKRGGGIYSTRGGGQGYALPWKKNSAICWVFLLLFCMWGPFCYVFLFIIGAARALTPVQMFVRGGGGGGRGCGGKPKKDHHKNIKKPPHTIKKVAKKAPTWRKSR